MPASLTTWPCHFAARDFKLPRLALEKGKVFPEQDRFMIRGWCRAFDPEAWTKAFEKLPVRTLDVGTADMMAHIVKNGLTFEEARKLLNTKAASAPATGEAA